MSEKISSSGLARPLSPHLQIWKWTLIMAMSILHRASGIALSVGTLMLVWMLCAAAAGRESYQCFLDFAESAIGQVMLFGWTGAIFFHLCAGVRHLLMDAGYLINVPHAKLASRIVLLLALALTLGTWGCLKYLF